MGKNSQAFDLKDEKCETTTFIDSTDGLEKYEEITLEGRIPNAFEIIDAVYTSQNIIYINLQGGTIGSNESDLYKSKPPKHFRNVVVDFGGSAPPRQDFLIVIFYWKFYGNGKMVAAPKTTGESILVGV